MKFTKIFLILLFSTFVCCAQDKKNNMVIHQTDGSKVKYQTELIDSITFEEVGIQQDIKTEVTVTKVYGDGTTYCAFTSLVKHNDIYYLAFREGDSHVGPGDYGVIRIMRSLDGIQWELNQTLKVEQIDLRDPDISIMPNGKMMIVCGARMLAEGDIYITRTFYSIENDNGIFSIPEPTNLPEEIIWPTCSWVWRLTWRNGVGYGVCYGNENISLVKTIDGKNYSVIKHLNVSGGPNECQIRFAEDGTAYMLVRRSLTNGKWETGYMGKSVPPYEDWVWKKLGIYLAGEDFLIDNNRLVVATRMTQNIGDRTAVWFGNLQGDFNWCYTLPYGGESGKSDTAYAGMLNEENYYWVSYYAIHEGEKPSIYIAKIPKIIVVF